MQRLNSIVTLDAGASISGFRIERTLGQGGMGTVFLATQLSLNRQVALKVLKPTRVRTPGAAEAFLREASRTAQLNHPNLVAVHAAGRDEESGMVWYAMSYVDGASLRRVVCNQGSVPVGAALRLAASCARALGHAHSRGLVHRDFKPDNVLINRADKSPLVADLGLAMDRLGGQSLNSAKTLAVVGTPEYSAPEQSRNPGRATPASDVFSLGCTLYYLLTGREPFDGETLIDLIVRVCSEDPPWTGLEGAPRELLETLMAKDPEERPEDGNAAAELIEETLADLTSPNRKPIVRRRRTRRRL